MHPKMRQKSTNADENKKAVWFEKSISTPTNQTTLHEVNIPSNSNVSDNESSVSLGLRVRTENKTFSQPTMDIQFTTKRQNFILSH